MKRVKAYEGWIHYIIIWKHITVANNQKMNGCVSCHIMPIGYVLDVVLYILE